MKQASSYLQYSPALCLDSHSCPSTRSSRRSSIMSSNNENAMARFLFAILQQKTLKDIDWNEVAHNPILSQPITNGHAARMRYSRFKSSLLGTEPTRRNRTTQPKSRVTKSKKDLKTRREDTVKTESVASSPCDVSESVEPQPPRVKREASHFNLDSRLTPGLTPAPIPTPTSMSNAHIISTRLLTPCSDSEGFTRTPVLTASPTNEMMYNAAPFDFHTSPFPEQLDPAWPHGTTFFNAATFPNESFGSSCDHPRMQHHTQAQYDMPSHSIETETDHVDVKHEDWDQYH
ncbi:hypothetical protein F5Y15DRAFT_375687 [Xylariaceae sp. FL0016]|nr:hypothetical protein F5Y15DRAFT_375687 [Xylariaceae sp. FL0016]